MSKANRDRKKNRTIVNPVRAAQVGATNAYKLPVISAHDIRRAREGVKSIGNPNVPVSMISIAASLHSEPPSKYVGELVYTNEFHHGGALHQEWQCPPYYGLVRRYPAGFPIGGGPFATLSISRIDETACHDWRDFQQLKNLICGQEWEGVELYPAESRHLDPSNRYYMWCVPQGVYVFGLVGRSILDAGQSLAPQRPFPRAAHVGGAPEGK